MHQLQRKPPSPPPVPLPMTSCQVELRSMGNYGLNNAAWETDGVAPTYANLYINGILTQSYSCWGWHAWKVSRGLLNSKCQVSGGTDIALC